MFRPSEFITLMLCAWTLVGEPCASWFHGSIRGVGNHSRCRSVQAGPAFLIKHPVTTDRSKYWSVLWKIMGCLPVHEFRPPTSRIVGSRTHTCRLTHTMATSGAQPARPVWTPRIMGWLSMRPSGALQTPSQSPPPRLVGCRGGARCPASRGPLGRCR